VFEYTVSEDNQAPKIKSVEAVNKNTVLVVFNEWAEETSAETAGNYTITGGTNPDVTVAVLDADNAKRVILTTEELVDQTTYTLQVDNVRDRSSDPDNKTSGAQKQFTFEDPHNPYTYTVKVADGDDDAEEYQDGTMDPKWSFESSDLELVYDSSSNRGNQTVGIRFTDVYIPQNTTISNAYIQFSVDNDLPFGSSGSLILTIRAEQSDDAPQFKVEDNNISERIDPLSESVGWNITSEWTVAHTRGAEQRTDITDVIQEIVSRSEWRNGNSLVVIIINENVTDTDFRTAESADDNYPAHVPELRVNW